jgi:hypothetical protein
VAVVNERHDAAHPVEDDSAWNESLYFNAYDHAADIGFFTRIGIRPKEGRVEGACFIWLPRQGVARIVAVAPRFEVSDEGFEVDGIRYEKLQSMSEWRIRCEGEAEIETMKGALGCVVDATFHALTPPLGGAGDGGHGASGEAGRTVARGHFEQAGRWSGRIEIEGRRFELGDTLGNRDRSWGPRRWEQPRMWRWFSINVGDFAHFGGVLITTDAGELHRGWVWREGEHASIRRWDVSTELDADGLTQRVVHVLATDKADRVHALHGELLRMARGVLREDDAGRTVWLDGLARWTYEGRVGYGIAEYLHQLDPQGRPLVPVA